MIIASINTILDILISLSLIYLVTSMLCIAITEWIAHIFGFREKGMEKALELIYDPKTTKTSDAQIKSNPLLEEYRTHNGKLPKWIPASVIVNATEATKLGISQEQLTHRFKSVMTQQTDQFRTNARLHVFIAACAVGLCLNLDSINITQQLYTNPAIREALVSQATEVVKQEVGETCPDPKKPDECYSKRRTALLSTLKDFESPIGKPFWETDNGILLRLLGILITAFATSQGAPFWFQILQQLLTWRKVTNPDS
jgi:hypothetical protein